MSTFIMILFGIIAGTLITIIINTIVTLIMKRKILNLYNYQLNDHLEERLKEEELIVIKHASQASVLLNLY